MARGRDGGTLSGRKGRFRGLSEADRELWSRVVADATPLHPRRGAPGPEAEPPDPPAGARLPAPAAVPRLPALLPGFRVGEAAHVAPATHRLAPGPVEHLRADALRMDHKTHKRMTRGKMVPEARIDLHGMTLAVAKSALAGFILSAQASGRRLVLVITGKGKGDHGPLPTRSGALRHEVPHWLRMAPVAGAVLQVVPAHLRHGGTGAYYVYLRRSR